MDATDGGTSWTQVWTTTSPITRWINSITVDPQNPYHVYVTMSGLYFPNGLPFAPHILEATIDKSAIKNTAWSDITGNLAKLDMPVNKLVMDGSTLFMATDVGVFASTNDGGTWSTYGQGLPIVQVEDLLLTDGMLIAATHGRGMWVLSAQTSSPSITTVAPGTVLPGGTIAISGSDFGIRRAP